MRRRNGGKSKKNPAKAAKATGFWVDHLLYRVLIMTHISLVGIDWPIPIQSP